MSILLAKGDERKDGQSTPLKQLILDNILCICDFESFDLSSLYLILNIINIYSDQMQLCKAFLVG